MGPARVWDGELKGGMDVQIFDGFPRSFGFELELR